MDQKRERVNNPEDYRRWAHHAANRLRLPGDPIHDDLVQEAVLAIWQAMERVPDASAVYYARAGRSAMMQLLRGRGQTGSRGGQHYRPDTTTVNDEGWDVLDARLASAPWDRVETAMMVREALRELPEEDRDLVWEWACGTPYADLSRDRGKSRAYAHTRITRDILPELRRSLGEEL